MKTPLKFWVEGGIDPLCMDLTHVLLVLCHWWYYIKKSNNSRAWFVLMVGSDHLLY